MTLDRRGRFDAHATVSHMRWAEDPGGERRDGLRIGYGRAFCFIPESEAMNLATALLDYIETNNLHQRTSTNTNHNH